MDSDVADRLFINSSIHDTLWKRWDLSRMVNQLFDILWFGIVYLSSWNWELNFDKKLVQILKSVALSSMLCPWRVEWWRALCWGITGTYHRLTQTFYCVQCNNTVTELNILYRLTSGCDNVLIWLHLQESFRVEKLHVCYQILTSNLRRK